MNIGAEPDITFLTSARSTRLRADSFAVFAAEPLFNHQSPHTAGFLTSGGAALQK